MSFFAVRTILTLFSLSDYKEDANNKKKLNYVDLRDEIIARQAHGIAVPETALAMMNEIELYAVKMLTFMVSGSYKRLRKDILRLACGPVLHLIHDNMDASVWNDDFYKLQLYACHDSMLLALLVTLGIFSGKWPPFAADLVFETYEDKAGRRWVRVLYLGEPQKLAGAEHGDVISREKFTQLIGPYAITVDVSHVEVFLFLLVQWRRKFKFFLMFVNQSARTVKNVFLV